MNRFKDEYQPRVIADAKVCARALNENGLNVAGDPAIDFSETHQVILEVGTQKGRSWLVGSSATITSAILTGEG